MTRLLKRLGWAWFIWRLFGPETPPRFSGRQEHPWRVPGRTVFVGEHEFFVRELGPPKASPLVLVHGWGDHSLMLWQFVAPILAEDHRIVMVDSRNAGKSDRIREGYDIATVADELAGVMDVLGIDEAPVVGYSMGGMVVQELAHRHPRRVTRMVLGGTAGKIPAWGGGGAVYSWMSTLLIRALDRLSRVEISLLRTRYLRRVGAIEDAHVRFAWSEHMARDPELYWQAAWAISRFDARPWLGAIRVPALVILTGADQLVPAAAQYELAATLPDAEIVELTGARHEAPLTHAEDMAKAIATFVGV